MKNITIVWVVLGLTLAPLANIAVAKEREKDAVSPGQAEKAELAARKKAEKEAEKAAKEAAEAEKKAQAQAAKEAKRVKKEVEKAEKEAIKRAKKEAELAKKQQPKLSREERRFLERQSRLESQISELNELVQNPDVAEGVFQSIWREHGISIKRLKKQVEENPDVGLGDLLVANLIARSVHKSVEEVVQAHNDGAEWGTIAKLNNVALPQLIEQTYQVGIVARAVANGSSATEG